MSDTSFSGRDANGRFVTGNAGGPGPLRNPVSATIGDFDRLGMAAGEKLIGMILEHAMQGNLKAAEMVLRPVWPVRRNRPIEVERDPEDEAALCTIETHGAAANAMLMSAAEEAHITIACADEKRWKRRKRRKRQKTVSSSQQPENFLKLAWPLRPMTR